MRFFLINILLIVSLYAGHTYDCSGINNYAARTAFVSLKHLTKVNTDDIEYNKTKVILIASEKVGNDLYKDVHLITFFLKDNSKIELIRVNNSSSEECSVNEGNVYLVYSKLSDLYQ